MTTTLEQITDKAGALADRRRVLNTIVTELNKGIEALKAERLDELRAAIVDATDAWGELEALIQASPELFIKPRTVRAHGITFGVEKGKGAIDIPDPAATVRLIRKHFPDQADVLVITQEIPAKMALAQLTAAELRRVGCELTDTGDKVVIRPADGEVDKLVRALIKAAIDDAGEGARAAPKERARA